MLTLERPRVRCVADHVGHLVVVNLDVPGVQHVERRARGAMRRHAAAGRARVAAGHARRASLDPELTAPAADLVLISTERHVQTVADHMDVAEGGELLGEAV